MGSTYSSDDPSDDTFDQDDIPDQAELERTARVVVRRAGVAVVVGALLVALIVVQTFLAYAASTADKQNYCAAGPQFPFLDGTLHVEWLVALVVLIGAESGVFLARTGVQEAGMEREPLGAIANLEFAMTLVAFALLVLFAAGYTYLLPYKCGL